MKINFDQLFLRSQHLHPYDLGRQSLLTLEPSRYRWTEKPVSWLVNPQTDTQSLGHSRREQIATNTVVAAEKLKALNALIQQKQKKSKKPKPIAIKQLTKKLYNPPPCHKKSCKQYECRKKQLQQDQMDFQNSKNKAKNQKKKSPLQSRPPAYIRMFYRNAINASIKTERAKSKETTMQRTKSISSPSYLKDYIPFYDRLQRQVARSRQKLKLLKNNPQFGVGQVKKMFQPTLIASKYKVSSRHKQIKHQQTLNHSRVIEDLNMSGSMNSSFVSLDRSVEMLSKVEDHFFRKMSCIFIDLDTEIVRITEQAIELLSEIEFKILRRFIMQIERTPVSPSEFQHRIRDYYYALPFNQKQELRRHQVKRKNRHFAKPVDFTFHNSSRQYTEQSISTVNVSRNYHRKLQGFV